MGGVVFPPCSFAWGLSMVGVMTVMEVMTSFKRTYASICGSQDCCSQCPWPHGRPLSTHACARNSWASTGKSGSVSCGVTTHFSWVLVKEKSLSHVRLFVTPWTVTYQSPLSILYCLGNKFIHNISHYCLHYLHHSLVSGQTTGREHRPTHQQKIGLKIYWACPCPSEQDPVSPSFSLSHQEAITLLSLSSEGRQNENHNHRKQIKLIIWTTALSNSMKVGAMPCRATQERWVMVEISDKTWSTGEENGKPLQYSCLENPMNSTKRQKDRTLKDELPRSIGAHMLLEISGEITPERMKRWNQSENNAQL